MPCHLQCSPEHIAILCSMLILLLGPAPCLGLLLCNVTDERKTNSVEKTSSTHREKETQKSYEMEEGEGNVSTELCCQEQKQ